jgi:dihydrofolate synthase/folylpolyglutamate synthase
MDDMLQLLLKENYTVYLTSFNDDRAISTHDYKSHGNLIITESFQEAIQTAYLKKSEIVVTGSLHFISAVRKFLIDSKKS